MNDIEGLYLTMATVWSILLFCPETVQYFHHRPHQVCGKYHLVVAATIALVKCGRPRSYYDNRRIINGQEVRPHEYPWMALLLSQQKAVCGGSVINNYYVLTAGHCKTEEEVTEDFTVVLGVHDRITMDNEKARMYSVEKIIIHPKYYDGFPLIYDIALFRLQKEIKFDFFVRPICLPHRGEDFSRHRAVVTGWGAKTFDTQYKHRYLHQVELSVLTERDCAQSSMQNVYTPYSYQMLCAYGHKADSCKGDSGGPLFTKVDKNLMVQIGIVSFGRGCAEANTPAIYTKVSYFVNWIYENTWDAKYCLDPRQTHISYNTKYNYKNT